MKHRYIYHHKKTPPSSPLPPSDRTFILPLADSTLSGTVPYGGLEVTGTDIVSVMFLVDGAPLSGPEGSAPWQGGPLDTTAYANGPHVLQADIVGPVGVTQRISRNVNFSNVATTLAIGGHFQRPPETTEASWVANYCNGRNPDINSDFQHRAVANAANDWQYLTVANYGNGSWDNWGAWLAARPTRRIDVALGMCPWPTNCSGSSCGTNGQLLASVAAGDHDDKFVTWATWMKGYGLGGSASRPIYVRLGHEMDGQFYPWGCGRTNTTLQDNYAAAFRKIVTVLRGVSATNFKFVWCPNDPPWVANDLTWLSRVYPGNDYVDVIAMDTYDRNTPHYTTTSVETTTTRNLSWTNYTEKALNNMAAFADPKGKPMAIGEFCYHYDSPLNGTTHRGGGDNPIFIENLYNWCTSHNVLYALLFRASGAASGEGHDLAFYPNALQKWKDTFCTLPNVW